MKNKTVLTIAIFAISLFIIPQMTFASWWKPNTWKIFNRKSEVKIEQKIIATSTPNNVISQTKKATTTPTLSRSSGQSVGAEKIEQKSEDVKKNDQSKEIEKLEKEIVPKDCNFGDIRNNKKIDSSIWFDLLRMDKKLTDVMLLYLNVDHKLDDNEIKQIEKNGVTVYKDSFIPPLKNHPLGFYLTKSRLVNICRFANLDFVKKINSAEEKLEFDIQNPVE